jgi:hypothetical protein
VLRETTTLEIKLARNISLGLTSHPHDTVWYFRVNPYFNQKTRGGDTHLITFGLTTERWKTTTEDCKGGLKYLQTMVHVPNAHPLNEEAGTKKAIDEWECIVCPVGGDCRANGGKIWESDVRNLYGVYPFLGVAEIPPTAQIRSNITRATRTRESSILIY